MQTGTIDSRVREVPIIEAGKPWAECPTASGMICEIFYRKIKGMSSDNYHGESKIISGEIDRAAAELFISLPQRAGIIQALAGKVGEYEINHNAREKQRLLALAKSMKEIY